jgi:hypothetical protein
MARKKKGPALKIVQGLFKNRMLYYFVSGAPTAMLQSCPGIPCAGLRAGVGELPCTGAGLNVGTLVMFVVCCVGAAEVLSCMLPASDG